MKKTMLMMLLTAISTGAMAEWVKVSETDSANIYVDSETIRKDGNLRKVWQIRDLIQRDKTGKMSVRTFNEYDCKEGRTRILSGSDHSEPMGSGRVLAAGSGHNDWDYLAPGTSGATILKFVCSK